MPHAAGARWAPWKWRRDERAEKEKEEEEEVPGEVGIGIDRGASGGGCETKNDEARDEEGSTNAHVSIVAAAMTPVFCGARMCRRQWPCRCRCR